MMLHSVTYPCVSGRVGVCVCVCMCPCMCMCMCSICILSVYAHRKFTMFGCSGMWCFRMWGFNILYIVVYNVLYDSTLI